MGFNVKLPGNDEGERVLMVVNPVDEALGDYSEEMMRLTEAYDGKTVKVAHVDYINDPVEGIGEYDETFIMDNDGLDEIDQRKLRGMANRVKFAGGPVDDIARVYKDAETILYGYGLLDGDYVFDHGVVDSEGNVLESEIERVSDLLEWDEDSTRARFRRHDIEEILETLD